MEKERIKVAIVLYTRSLENDDRVRKEINSLRRSSENLDFFIYAIDPRNVERSGYTSYDVGFHIPFLKTRERFGSGSHKFIKALDFFFKIRGRLEGFNIVWCADDMTVLFPLLLRRKIIIWDLHEIPQFFLSFIWGKKLFHIIENKCSVIIHANPHRIEFLRSFGIISDIKKHIYIRNFPDQSFIDSKLTPPSYTNIQEWLDGKNYVYLQGISDSSRYPFNSVASILRSTDLKVVVTALMDENVKNELLSEFCSQLDQRVYFTGMLNQMHTPCLIRGALFSIVLYNQKTPNARLCEANRFYQSLVFGVPVIAGSNVPMKEIIDKHKCGIAMQSDGADIDELIMSVSKLVNNYPAYKENAEAIKDQFVWDDQSVYNKLSNFFLA